MIARNRFGNSENGFPMPPCSEQAERSVLGSILRINLVLDEVLSIVGVDDFYHDAHQKIFAAIVTLCLDRRQRADLVTLAELLKQQGLIQDIGGYSYLADIWESSPAAANVEYYAKIVRDKSVMRQLIHASTDTLRNAYSGMPSDEALEEAERCIFAIGESVNPSETKSLEEHAREAFDRIDGRIVERSLPSGFLQLDKLIDGFKAGQLALIAARPSHGKTSLAACLAMQFMRLDAPFIFVSLEESGVSMAQRLLSAESGVPLSHITSRKLNDEEMRRLILANNRMNKGLMHISDTSGQTVQRIAANARRLKRRHGIQAVIIDYVQLVAPRDRKPPRHEQVAEISRSLKIMARDLDVPVIALAQLNRGPEDRSDHKPRMADLRESGSLEADADLGLLLHRPEMYDQNDRPGEIEVIVDKQRLGPRGIATLAYVADCMKITDRHLGTEFESPI